MAVNRSLRVTLDVAIMLAVLCLITAGAIWLAWVTDFQPNTVRLTRLIAAIILFGFVVFSSLTAALYAKLRINHYAGRRSSTFHRPLLFTFGTWSIYFGVASISAVDVFYDPTKRWPVLLDPGFRLFGTALVISIVTGPVWALYEVVRDDDHPKRWITIILGGAVLITGLVIAAAVVLGGV